MKRARNNLTTEGLLLTVSRLFKGLKLPQIKGNSKEPITIHDCLMSAVSVFGLKYPSLLQFDKDYRNNELLKHNLKTLYHVEKAPCDTYMREKLDEVDPHLLRKPFKKLFSKLQRAKMLDEFAFYKGYYLLSIDGTSFFESDKVYCPHCCVKEYRNGNKSYYHQIYCGAIVHPNKREVIPLAPEPIMKEDGNTKNDCETNAAKRFITHLRREHPHLKVIVIADSLVAKGPFIKELTAAKIPFILTAKEGDHKSLFEFVNGICTTLVRNKSGVKKSYRYVNNVPLNDKNSDIEVNFLEYIEENIKGKKLRFVWITNIKIEPDNIDLLVQGGRARWKIENETFNTLKNQGYHFEHNFGHGYKYLSSVFAMLMMLAFSIDQMQALCDKLFQAALLKKHAKISFWAHLRRLFFEFKILSWESIWQSIAYGNKSIELTPNTS